MLGSHLGFAIGTHHCGGIAVESKVMIGHVHLDCGMSNMAKDCERKSDGTASIKKTPCCANEYLSIDIENEIKPKVSGSAINLEFLVAFFTSYVFVFSSEENTPQYTHYDPPLVTRNISILHQVIII
jgi:hypothetical protein